MYLIWLVILLVLLGFSLRPVPYLEGMKSNNKKYPAKNQSRTSQGTYKNGQSQASINPYTPQGQNVNARMTPNHNFYKVNTPQGTYAGYNGQNVQASVNPNSSSYVANTPQGTYAGYNGQNVQATYTPNGYTVSGPNNTYSSCSTSMYGCCPDGITNKVDSNGSNCLPSPSPAPTSCSGTTYGCCPDQLTTKVDSNGSNCAPYPPPPAPVPPPPAPTPPPPAPVPAASPTTTTPATTTPATTSTTPTTYPPTYPSASYTTTPAPSSAPTSCSASSYGCCPDQLTVKVDANGSNCSSYPSNTMINTQPVQQTPELDAYNTSTVFLSPPTKKELTCPEPQPCPPCARCPEPSFDCKKVPNYSSTNSEYLPVPVLNDFSQFGM